MATIWEKTQGGLIVSCQALPNEPLHGAGIMARMALAAEQGGAAAIRANGADDVRSIKAQTGLPVIGIVKRDYPGYPIYITPTLREVDELLDAGADMIAFDATLRKRPNGCTAEELIQRMHSLGVPAMADVSTLEEAEQAERLGADCVSTTLSGYTPYSVSRTGPDYDLVEQAAERLRIPVFAEGRVTEPEQVAALLQLGAHAVVVGSAITRPQLIAERFAAAAGRRWQRDGFKAKG
ncbi:N-acetylmannosamine-6-phosphate 2-epimerase [Paenibacillus herberti]|uniref:Putative N-acetylmannosamine-6-phosphate 2-epimerase n=1 Tax=Paenibacillus herberti TaxID=1619309 RepID=A0A229NU63_9BACL|nr:N-acetylmannosamine-6-phosphate 2-epimerase [Paenibacillus herberti]OXM13423.1 N-acetylmannosamine-6-phosphate 2-epimerase [Paenibacillus herberti]